MIHNFLLFPPSLAISLLTLSGHSLIATFWCLNLKLIHPFTPLLSDPNPNQNQNMNANNMNQRQLQGQRQMFESTGNPCTDCLLCFCACCALCCVCIGVCILAICVCFCACIEAVVDCLLYPFYWMCCWDWYQRRQQERRERDIEARRQLNK